MGESFDEFDISDFPFFIDEHPQFDIPAYTLFQVSRVFGPRNIQRLWLDAGYPSALSAALTGAAPVASWQQLVAERDVEYLVENVSLCFFHFRLTSYGTPNGLMILFFEGYVGKRPFHPRERRFSFAGLQFGFEYAEIMGLEQDQNRQM